MHLKNSIISIQLNSTFLNTAITPLELYPPPPVPGGRYQPQHDNVQVKFPLHASHIMGVVIQVTSFSISARYEGAWSASRPIALPSLL